jgi:hypothetical protein
VVCVCIDRKTASRFCGCQPKKEVARMKEGAISMTGSHSKVVAGGVKLS